MSSLDPVPEFLHNGDQQPEDLHQLALSCSSLLALSSSGIQSCPPSVDSGHCRTQGRGRQWWARTWWV